MNLVCLSGRLTKDPELRQTKNDHSVCTFTLAVDEGYGDSKKTAFLSCVAWNTTAEFVGRNFHKGDPIELAGKLTSRSYERDGRKVYATEINVDHVNFTLARRHKDEEPAGVRPFAEIADEDGELPF